MSNMTTSDAQMRNKRVRVDPTVTTTPDLSSAAAVARSKVPKARASAAIAAHTATLLPQLSTILQNLGDAHLGLLHRYYNKSNQLRRMEPDDTIIPRSARLNFELSVPKSIMELPDFLLLQENVKSDLEQMKKSLRNHVISALKIEMAFYTSELKDHLTTVLHTATAALLIANGNATVNAHRAVANLISAHHTALFKHVCMSAEEFKLAYMKIHALPSFPVLNDATAPPPPSTNTQSQFFTQPSIPAPAPPPVVAATDTPQLDMIYRTICCIFIDPFDSYLEQHRANTIELALRKLAEEDLTVAATATAQLDVEQEASVSRTLLNELIGKETKKNTVKLSTEIDSLKQMIRSLKGQRGPTSTRGASLKTNASTSSKAKPRNANAKAGARARDSSAKKNIKSSQKKKKNTAKQKPASRIRKNK